MPCSGEKSETSFTFVRFFQNVDRRLPFKIAAGLIGHKADLHPVELFEIVAFENVDAVENRLRILTTADWLTQRASAAIRARRVAASACSLNFGICAATCDA